MSLLKYSFSNNVLHYLEFNNNPIVETQEINENTLVDLDQQGNICAITLEHAKSLTDLNAFSLETIVATQLRRKCKLKHLL